MKKGAVVVLVGLLLAGCAQRMEHENTTLSDVVNKKDASLQNMSASQLDELAGVMVQQGRYETAYLYYSRILKENPTDADVFAKRGLSLLYSGMQKNAEEDFSAALKLAPDNIIANYGMGALFYKAGLMTDAKKHLETSVTKNSIYRPKALNILGIIADVSGDPEKAEEYFRSCIVMNAQSGELYNNLGACLLAQGRTDDAEAALRKAVKLGFTEPRAYNNLGIAFARKGNFTKAFEAFKRAGGEASAHNNIGYFHYVSGNYDQAAKSFERAIAVHPSHYATAEENLSKARLEMGPVN